MKFTVLYKLEKSEYLWNLNDNDKNIKIYFTTYLLQFADTQNIKARKISAFIVWVYSTVGNDIYISKAMYLNVKWHNKCIYNQVVD